MFKLVRSFKKVNDISRNISICKIVHNEEKSRKKKVKETVELVTLVDQNDKILGLKPKGESEKLARKLNLSLERVNDTKYGKTYPAYKMFSTADILKAAEKTSTAKVLKKLPLNSRISDNDLNLKIRVIRKWMAKNCEVHVGILCSNGSEALMRKVFFKVEDELKNEYRFVDIREKKESIKFIIISPKKTVKKDATERSEKQINSTESN